MRGISSVINIHLRHKLTWFYLPWMIMAFSFLVNLLIGVLINGETIYTGGLATHLYIHVRYLIDLGDSAVPVHHGV